MKLIFSWRIFRKNFKYKISRKSVQWELNCSMRTALWFPTTSRFQFLLGRYFSFQHLTKLPSVRQLSLRKQLTKLLRKRAQTPVTTACPRTQIQQMKYSLRQQPTVLAQGSSSATLLLTCATRRYGVAFGTKWRADQFGFNVYSSCRQKKIFWNFKH